MVKAMDAGEAILQQKYGFTVSQWVLSGASKRGWTTWLTGAVDPRRATRIKAIVPVVLDGINFRAFLQKMFASYNGWSWVMQPYIEAGLPQHMGEPIFDQWAREIDPFQYRTRLTMPKFAVDAGDGEFQLTDSSNDWNHAMPGEMKTLLVYDADHPLIPNMGMALQGMAGFVQAVMYNRARPDYAWTIDPVTGRVTVTTSEPPKQVTLRFVTVPGPRRDFRNTMLQSSLPAGATCALKMLGGCARFVWWNGTTTDFTRINATAFTALQPVPPAGYFTAFYFELEFDSPAFLGAPMLFSTGASILPLAYPYPPCTGANCTQTLV